MDPDSIEQFQFIADPDHSSKMKWKYSSDFPVQIILCVMVYFSKYNFPSFLNEIWVINQMKIFFYVF